MNEMKSSKKIFLLIVAGAVVLASCTKIRNDLEPFRPPVSRTFIVYIGGDNNLYINMLDNIKQMIESTTRETLNNGRIVIYFSPRMDYIDNSTIDPDKYPAPEILKFTTPQLIEIYVDKSNKGAVRILKSYDKQSAASPAVLKQVINDVREYAPAESYCIDFSSHGTGWLPATTTTPVSAFVAASRADSGDDSVPPKLQTFSDEGRRGQSFQMNIEDLAAALPDKMFDMIMFDACLMGSVEVAYELRNKTPYIVASVAEIPAAGFPYSAILKYIFTKELDPEVICREYITYYDSNSNATVALYNTAGLPALAAATREVVQHYGNYMRDMQVNYSKIYLDGGSGSFVPVQYYYRTSSQSPTAIDMGDVMDILLSQRDPTLLAAWKATLSDVVLYSASTKYSNDGNSLFSTSSYPFYYLRLSGITMHVPALGYDAISASQDWNAYFYNNTQWGKDVFGQ